ncbi:sulfotransferase domain-containing protein [Piscinibacter sp.]|uniref:sulfotransferase domain-containing protein n=1 Tax=Piscinibacter sp. TaxID=1903157 RepID=UPI002CA24839|nr:sulfotransferase domain-containing protein [Albitalea sp.]HUG23776.1 sulfotransferase domain-containing protein [Albitalea sp.]
MNPDQRLPHFIIIGAMKSATSTLHDQLSRQPGIFMSEPKEPNFFSDDDVYARGLSWYTGLFAPAAADALLGESSTHYTKLPTHPHTVQRLRAALSAPRLIYVMRHPVDRLVSHYIHEWTMGKINCPIDDAVEQYPELVAYGSYSMQLEPYFDTFGTESVLPVFFDRLTREPQAELSRVCRFVGYPGTPVWHTNAGPRNVSSERLRRFPLHDVLVDAALARKLRRTLVPQRLREWAKGKMSMQERPVLSAPVQARLESVFDRDLARLGSWLGTSLNCGSFKAATGEYALDWSEHRRSRSACPEP